MIKRMLFAASMLVACSAYGVTDNNQNGRYGNPGHVWDVPACPPKQVYNVPDTGSTAALLSLSVIAMAIGAMRLRKV